MKTNDIFLRPRPSPELAESGDELMPLAPSRTGPRTLYCFAETRKARDIQLKALVAGARRNGQGVITRNRSCFRSTRGIIYYGWVMVDGRR